MKKIMSLAGLTGMMALLLAPMNVTTAGYGLAGCGLGAIIIGPKPGFMQLFAATSNATFASQTFGITTGTSECGRGAIAYEMEQRTYLTHNIEGVQKDIAAGKGEKLANLAYLMGCSADSVEAFGSAAQQNYGQIFAEGENSQPEYVLHRIKTTVKSDASLSTSCNRVWL